MKVIDCLMYAYEADALAVRLRELAGVVDTHVVVQGTHTFRGETRAIVPLDGVENVVVDMSTRRDAWAAEAFLRDWSLFAGVFPDGDDVLYLVADCDEIPHPDAIAEAIERVPTEGPMRLLTSHRQWAMNLETVLHISKPCKAQAVIGTAAHFAAVGGAHRARVDALRNGWTDAQAVGWHVTNLMSPEAVEAKIRAYAHSEYDTAHHRNQLAAMRDQRRDYLGRSELRVADDVPSCAGEFPHLLA